MTKWILPLFFISLSIFGIDVRTGIEDVHHEGCCEQIGNFTLVFTEDAFPDVSYENPSYIRFRILHAHGWARTLVDLRPDSNPDLADPINLAIRTSDSSHLASDLPPNAVQLVRLIKGEKDGWIRINVPTSLWLYKEGSHTSPNYDDKASLSLGIEGHFSVYPSSSTPSNGNEFQNSGELASTIFYANYENTPKFNAGDMDILDFISFDHKTTGVETDDIVVPGTNTGVSFSNDTEIARGASHIACYRMTTDPQKLSTPPQPITLSKLSAIDLRHNCEAVPSVFISNCSDYEWHPGSQFFVCLSTVRLNNDRFVESYECSTEGMFFKENTLQVYPADNESWSITPGYINGKIIGYRITLLEGTFPVHGFIELSGMALCLDNNIMNASMILFAYADILSPLGTDGILSRYGPVFNHIAELNYEDIYLYRRVLPYTAYDRKKRQFHLRTVNLSDQPSRFVSRFSNKHGLLLRIRGETSLPPMGSEDFSIKDTYGEQADEILAWVEQYSDQPFESTGVILDQENGLFDLVRSNERSWQTLVAPHITESSLWETTAYILASGNESPRFFFNVPGQMNQHISAILFPGATVVYKDSDFFSNESRISWFQVDAEISSASGLLVYHKVQDGGQLASLPLNNSSSTNWEFDHLGSKSNGWWNGCVINNPNPISTKVTLSMLDQDRQILSRGELEIQALTRKAFLLESVFPDSENINATYLTLESDESVLSFLLMGMEKREQLALIPGNLKSDTQLVLPYFNSSDTYWTGIAVVNTTNQDDSFYLEAHLKDGTVKKSSAIELPGNGKSVFLLDQYIQDITACTHLTIKASSPIRGFGLIGNQTQSQLASLPLVPFP
ncbi:MAG: hypothetical protein CR997_13045 [Acidobacteria bacterium]|nr:MAG: hypothetical protein CR997_13045 [Acidobacteriota bacterium]